MQNKILDDFSTTFLKIIILENDFFMGNFSLQCRESIDESSNRKVGEVIRTGGLYKEVNFYL